MRKAQQSFLHSKNYNTAGSPDPLRHVRVNYIRNDSQNPTNVTRPRKGTRLA